MNPPPDPPPAPRPGPPQRPPTPPRDRHARVGATFNSVLERPMPDREAFLATACADDTELQREVRELLAAHAKAEGFLKTDAPFSPEIEHELARLKPEEAGERIGPYKLLQQIGEGGFGTVWMAEQELPVRRRVALKIIKMGMDTKEVIARFEQERQALALMEHPNIAKVFDAGATPFGRPFFVMELVRGVPITTYCDEQALSTGERLELFTQVCAAIQHAHQKGVIHRDIKPSNVLVTINDGEAVAKVIDFGVAKATQSRLTDLTLFTQFQQMIGTPLYMSPEQAEMTSLDIDTRSDIYSLGVLLYELLTGSTPIDAATLRQAGLDEIRRIIREVDPPKPSTRFKTLGGAELTETARRHSIHPDRLPALLRGDLDWIVMRCLEKDRKRRYESAAALAQDLRRHLANEIITARPPTASYLLSKLIRRNRLAFAASAAVALAVLVGLGVSTVLFLREKNARLLAAHAEASARHAKEEANFSAVVATGEAERANKEATAAQEARQGAEDSLRKTRETIAQLRFRKAMEAIEAQRFGEGLARLAAILRENPQHPTAGSLIVSILSHRNFPLPVGAPLAKAGGRAILGPNGTLLTFDVWTPALLWDLKTRQAIGGPYSAGNVARFSKDGRRLYIGGTFGWDARDAWKVGAVCVWDVQRRELLAKLEQPTPVWQFQISDDDSKVVTGSGRSLRVWSGVDFALQRDGIELEQRSTNRWMLSRDGKYIASRESIWNLANGTVLDRKAKSDGGVPWLLHPTQPVFLSASETWTLNRFADNHPLVTARRKVTNGPQDGRFGFVVDPTFSRMATGGRTHVVWSLETGDFAAALQPALPGSDSGRDGGVYKVSPDGLRILSVGLDGALIPWSMIDGSPVCEPVPGGAGTDDWNPAFLPDGQHIASPGPSRTMEFWQITDGRELPIMLRPVEGLNSIVLHPSERFLVAGSNTNRGAQCLDLETLQPIGATMPAEDTIRSMTLAPDLETLAIGTSRSTIRFFHVPSGQLLSKEIEAGHGGQFTAHGFTHDSKRLLLGRDQLKDTLSLWDWRSGERIWNVDIRTGGGSMHLSPDGQRIFSSGGLMFDAVTGTRMPGRWPAGAIAASWTRIFDKSGRTFASPIDGRRTGPAIRFSGTVSTAQFSPDEKWLSTGSTDRRIRIWSVADGRLIAPPLQHTGEINATAFSPNGQRFATGLENGMVQIWDVQSGMPLSLPLPHQAVVRQLVWSHDGSRLFVVLFKGDLVIYDTPELAAPAPQWLADLAEAVAGQRIDADDAMSSAGSPLATLRDRLLLKNPTDDYDRWLHWFFADRMKRTSSAFSKRSAEEVIALMRQTKSLESMQQVWRRLPTDVTVMEELAAEYAKIPDSHAQGHAKFLRAVADWNRTRRPSTAEEPLQPPTK